MALATVTGTITDHGGTALGSDVVLLFHPKQAGALGSALLAESPVSASVSGTNWSVELQDVRSGAQYTAEARWVEDGRNRSWWSRPFRVPEGGGPIGYLIAIPEDNGLIWVEETAVDTSRYDQYQYVEADGWIYKRKNA